MRVITGAAERGPVLSATALIAAIAALGLSVIQPSAFLIGAPLALLIPLAYAHKWLLAWRQQLSLLILVILFIPIKRYVMAGGLPFDLEPYRILVALMIAAWFTSLLIDPRVRFRKTGLEGPILLIAFASVASDAVNTRRIAELAVEPMVIKGLMFLGSFFLITYMIVSVTRTRRDVERLVEVLCAGGGILGIFAVIEYRTGYNFFDNLHPLMPFLQRVAPDGLGISRGGDVRVFASAQHPIALGGLFVMLVPLAIYLAMRPGKRIWWVVAVPVGIGALSSVSRTSIVMFAAAGLVFLWQRPRQTVKAWPLIVPAVVAIQFAIPGALRSIQTSFFPAGGLIAEQSAHADWSSKNRLSRIGPTLKEWEQHPLLGQGLTPRQPQLHPETFVLDNQWLKNLAETGIVGFGAWLWLFVRSIRRLARQGREETADGGWLEVSLSAAIASFAAGMFFYDAFSFVQVTVMLFVVLGFGAALAQTKERRVREPHAARAVRRLPQVAWAGDVSPAPTARIGEY